MASLGFAAFSVSMALGRFGGDAAILRFGAKRMLIGGALLGAFGLFLAIIIAEPMPAIFGFFLVGVGFSTAVPILFTAAAKTKSVNDSVAIASIATGGVVGFLAGPPLIGLFSEWNGLPFGLGLVAFLAVLAALLARFTRWPE